MMNLTSHFIGKYFITVFSNSFFRMILDDEKDELTVRASPMKNKSEPAKNKPEFVKPGPGGDN